MKKKKKEITSKELKEFLKDKVIILDCGHRHQLHNFSNTLVVTVEGKTMCHNCYY